MNSITVRSYTPSDYECISQIYDSARKIELDEAGLEIDFYLFSDLANWILKWPHIDVAVVNDQVVGFCAYTDEEIDWLYVSPDKLRQKIGRTLVENALCTEPNISKVEILYLNEPAELFFEKFDFRTEKIKHGVMSEDESIPLLVNCMSRMAKED